MYSLCLQGCHAIVYQTNSGIYGFHNSGGSSPSDFLNRAKLFSEFVNEHNGENKISHRLYGVTFVKNNQRGYPVDNSKTYWKKELLVFADQLNFKGKISGYDLYDKFSSKNESAYVEFRLNNKKIDVYVKKWEEDESLGRKEKKRKEFFTK
ncbi:hypothetical protein [Candidatus Sororendozoicomonas aggregata]|uniref:hypothetical protein n=1 Tax=Candidatus Sororendozoicomonas aggregata TaxID=3073239 RepID=UPI002ED67E90